MASDSTGGTCGTPAHDNDKEKHQLSEDVTPAFWGPKRRRATLMSDVAKLQTCFSGEHRCVYFFKYENGIVTMDSGVQDCIGIKRSCGELTMHVRDYAIFRGWVCDEINKGGGVNYRDTGEIVWNNPFTNTEYMIEGDMVNKRSDWYIHFHQRMLNPYKTGGSVELALMHYDRERYENRDAFVIQWCDWNKVQVMLEQLDAIIRGGRFAYQYNSIRNEVVQGYSADSDCNFMHADPSLCETDVRRRIVF